MGNVSYSAHISNGKSAITSKKALAGVAKHNLRKYKSADYSSDNIRLIYGTTDLFQDVKRVYHREFDDVVKEYNSRQKREDRKIKDYFEHVAGLNQDMAVEIIFNAGTRNIGTSIGKTKIICLRYLIIFLNACKSYCRSSRLQMRSYTLMKLARICMW